MDKRTILTIIITAMCVMNVFTSFIPDGPTYFDAFTEGLFNDDLASFWRVVLMAPTGILIILTALHIMEPKSSGITRNHLALAGITGFLLYLIIYGLMYLAVALAIGAGDFLGGLATGRYSASKEPGIFVLGWSSVLYPILFLSYVLVHRIMKYKTKEVESSFRKIHRSKNTRSYRDDSDYV